MQEFFSPLAFDFLWESAQVGELPYPLLVRSHGATEDERVSLRHRADAELKARGIRDPRGRLAPPIEDALHLLAFAPLTIDALHIPQFEAPTVGVLAAADDTKGVCAVQDADGIWLRDVPPDGLVSAVVGVLPGRAARQRGVGHTSAGRRPAHRADPGARVPSGEPGRSAGKPPDAVERTRHGRSAGGLRPHRRAAAAARRSAGSEQPFAGRGQTTVPGAGLVRHRDRALPEPLPRRYGRARVGHRRPRRPEDFADPAWRDGEQCVGRHAIA